MSIDKVVNIVNEVNQALLKVSPNSTLGGRKLLEAATKAFESLPAEKREKFIKDLTRKADVIKVSSMVYIIDDDKMVFRNTTVGKVGELQRKWLPNYGKEKTSPAAAKKKQKMVNTISTQENKTPETPTDVSIRGVSDSLTQIQQSYRNLCINMSTIEDPDCRSALQVLKDVQEALIGNPKDARLQKLNEMCQSILAELHQDDSMGDFMRFSLATDKIEQLRKIIE